MIPAKSDPLQKIKIGDSWITQFHRKLIIRRRLTGLDIFGYISTSMFLYTIAFQWFFPLNLAGWIGFVALFTVVFIFVNRRHAPIVFNLDSNQITCGKKVLGSCDMVQIFLTGDAISRTLEIYGPESEIWSTASNSKSKIVELEKILTEFLPPENNRIQNLTMFHDPTFDIHAFDDGES